MVVVDVDKQPAREVIQHYFQREMGWLFDQQVISFNTQNRDAAYDLIIGMSLQLPFVLLLWFT